MVTGNVLKKKCDMVMKGMELKKMPMKVIDIRKQLPQRKRMRRSMIMDTEEWQEAVKKIESGLKAHEGIELLVSERAKSEIGENAARILKYQLQKFIKERGLDLEVFFRGKDEATGLPITYVTVADRKSRG
jgi:hypothetical protein